MPATVSITVTAVNDAPVAQEQNVTTEEDVPKAITLVATDVEGDALAYLIATPPAHGVLSAISSNLVTYTPEANYNGPDMFAFRAADGSLTGVTAVVSITVTPVNDAPVAQPQSVTTTKDTAKMITLVAADVDGDSLVYLIATVPAHGTLSAVTSNRVTYTPAANYFGPDSFTFAAKDASLTSTPVTVSISVSQVNTVPIAQAQSVTTDEDTAKAITLVANDAEGDTLTYLIATGPAHGALSAVSSNQVTYTPAANYSGPDSFTFRASDAALTSTPATVSITVTAVNDAPVAQAQNVTTAEDTAKVITLVATDVETSALTYGVVTGPSHGSLSVVSSNTITYTPAANYSGPDSFTFKANDGAVDSAPATVSITVTPVNDAPAAQSQNVTTDEDTAVAIMLSASDVENAPLSYLIATVPAHGTLSAVSSNQVTYTPAANYNGPDSFTFRASDGSLTGAMATVSITVTPVNDVPVAQAQSISTVKNTDKAITLVATDVDGDALTYAAVTVPAHGTLSAISSNRVTYTPELGYVGPDSFTFKATDGLTDSAPATISINVTAGIVLPPNNTAPVPQPQSVTTVEDTDKVITLVAIDAQTNAMTYLVVTNPTHGTLSVIASNQVTYTPALNYAGADSFTFTATDGGLTGTPATVSITVTAVNDAPIALEQTVSTPADTSISITLTGTDADGDFLRYTILTDPAHGTLGRLLGDSVTYRPATGFNGIDSFTFRARDGSVTGMPATVYIRVGVVNTPPTLDEIPNVVAVVGETLQFVVQAHDSDVPSNTLSFTLGAMVNPPATMPVLDSHTGQFTWTAAGADEGKAFLFNVIVTDDGVPPLSTNETFQVSVNGRPPVVGISLLNGTPRLAWNSVTTRRYQLQFKNNLPDPAWSDLGPEMTATGPALSYDDESAQSHTNRFYRVLLIPAL
jgi:VCBS repeat-containing protein